MWTWGALSYLESRVSAPVTSVPVSVWVPIVNPLESKTSDPIGAVYQINVDMGVACFVYVGLLVDQFSCVKVLE